MLLHVLCATKCERCVSALEENSEDKKWTLTLFKKWHITNAPDNREQYYIEKHGHCNFKLKVNRSVRLWMWVSQQINFAYFLKRVYKVDVIIFKTACQKSENFQVTKSCVTVKWHFSLHLPAENTESIFKISLVFFLLISSIKIWCKKI